MKKDSKSAKETVEHKERIILQITWNFGDLNSSPFIFYKRFQTGNTTNVLCLFLSNS
jgi:hypothetical protein